MRRQPAAHRTAPVVVAPTASGAPRRTPASSSDVAASACSAVSRPLLACCSITAAARDRSSVCGSAPRSTWRRSRSLYGSDAVRWTSSPPKPEPPSRFARGERTLRHRLEPGSSRSSSGFSSSERSSHSASRSSERVASASVGSSTFSTSSRPDRISAMRVRMMSARLTAALPVLCPPGGSGAYSIPRAMRARRMRSRRSGRGPVAGGAPGGRPGPVVLTGGVATSPSLSWANCTRPASAARTPTIDAPGERRERSRPELPHRDLQPGHRPQRAVCVRPVGPVAAAQVRVRAQEPAAVRLASDRRRP